MRYIRSQVGQVHDLVLQENIVINNGEAFQLVGAVTSTFMRRFIYGNV